MKKLWKRLWLIKKIDEKEAEELKKIYNHYLDNRKEIMKNTSFRVEDVLGDIISKDSISPKQITKPNKILAQKIVNINFCIEINLSKPRKKYYWIQPSAPPA